MEFLLGSSVYRVQGVDYTHPSLGGGFGPNFKVIGGYDFVGNAYDGLSILCTSPGSILTFT
jgi:hypothetical protein